MPGRTMSASQQEQFIHSMQDQGVGVTRTKKGLLLRLPDGSSTSVHFTNSDVRAEKNLIARLRRSGVVHPNDVKADTLPKGITGYPASKATMAKIEKMVVDMGYPDQVTVQDVIAHCSLEHITASRGLFTMGFIPVMGKRNKRHWLTPQEILAKKPEEPEPESPTIPTPKEAYRNSGPSIEEAADPKWLAENTVTVERDATPEEEAAIEEAKADPVFVEAPRPEEVTLIDERDSWVVPLEDLLGAPIARMVNDRLAVLRAVGINYEMRVWKES